MRRYFTDITKNNPFGNPFHEAQCQPKKAESAVEEHHSCEYGSAKYYALCAFGGAVASSSTHLTIAPLDLIKCRIQADPAKYKSVVSGFKITVAEEGTRALLKGWAPAVIGYSLQGEERSYTWRTWVYLISSASAEFIADIPLAPMEAAKVRMQTHPGFPFTLRQAVPHIYKEEGLKGFYKGLVPLWIRQVPYTMVKFTCFETTIELLYKYVVPKPRHECSKLEQLVITFAAGYIAGVFCAIISHPADTVVSKLNQEKGSSPLEVVKKIGMAGLWKGLGVRIILIGTLSALQWFVYDSVKVWLKLPRPPPPEMPESLKKKLAEKPQ